MGNPARRRKDSCSFDDFPRRTSCRIFAIRRPVKTVEPSLPREASGDGMVQRRLWVGLSRSLPDDRMTGIIRCSATDLRVCRWQGQDRGQATGREGQAHCTIYDHDRWPPCVNNTAAGAVALAGCGKDKLTASGMSVPSSRFGLTCIVAVPIAIVSVISSLRFAMAAVLWCLQLTFPMVPAELVQQPTG